jgi:predicted choloylglycine hydrolase
MAAGSQFPGRAFEVRYQHIVVEGNPYEAGRLEGAFLRQAGRSLISYEPPEPEQAAHEMRRLYEAYSPGLIEEAQGVADGLGLPFERALFCACIGPAVQGCTHAVALPAITANRHLLVARNYDMGLAEADLCLCATRIVGQAGHLGFSDMVLGRRDGLNEHGLCVTLSNAWDPVPEEWREPHGLHHAIALRAALGRCESVDEAVDLWQSMPIGSHGSLLAADRSGRAALLEVAGRRRAVKRIGPDTDGQYIVCANHFTLIDVSDGAGYVPSAHSTRRYDALASWLEENRGAISGDGLKGFLDRGWDTGVSSYSPEHRAGTLWSMVLDVTAGTAEVRFGPPPDNEWHSFSLDGPAGVEEYTALFPHC